MVSVIIPCYNQGHFLGDAVRSVRAQTIGDPEIIVADDGSTDDTREVARLHGVRCVSQQNQGQGAARNLGLRHASRDFIIFLDSDDRLLPHAFETGLRYLTERPELAFAAGRCLVFDQHGVRTGTRYFPLVTRDHYAELLRSNFIWMPGCAVFRTAIVRQMGGFATDVTGAEDYDLYLRIARRCPIHHHDTFVAEYRQHGTSTSRRVALMLRSVSKVMARHKRWVKGDPGAERAWREGLRHWQQEYGEETVLQIRRQLRARQWRGLPPALWTLARYYPEALWHHPMRKISRLVRRQKPDLLGGAAL
jgi:hypothetical protein